MGLLGQHAQRRVSGFEVVFDHGSPFFSVRLIGIFGGDREYIESREPASVWMGSRTKSRSFACVWWISI
jgi:hypothetical protein